MSVRLSALFVWGVLFCRPLAFLILLFFGWMIFDRKIMLVCLVGLIVIPIIYLGYGVEQSDFWGITSGYGVAFLIYFLIYRLAPEEGKGLVYLLVASVVLRMVLIPAFPNLSDDIYRFVWDGRLLLAGYNPFDHLPGWYLEQGVEVPGITEGLFLQLNSPEYFTIYPPVCQGIFTLSSWLFPEDIAGAAICMKIIMVTFEAGSVYLLFRLLRDFGQAQKKALLYAFNPLIIIEITGNLHFEGAMVFFLLLGIYYFHHNKLDRSALAIGFSVASKLLPLIFLPFLIRRLGWQKRIRYFVICGLTVVLLFAPLLGSAFFSGFGSSLNLYFQKFEFNASVYYLLRELGLLITGYNQIAVLGPLLALGTLSSVLILAYRERALTMDSLLKHCLFAITIYLLFTPTVHPWYVTLPLILCLFTDFRYPVVWSGLIVLTYINYSYGAYFEQLWIVGLEYGLLMAWAWGMDGRSKG